MCVCLIYVYVCQVPEGVLGGERILMNLGADLGPKSREIASVVRTYAMHTHTHAYTTRGTKTCTCKHDMTHGA